VLVKVAACGLCQGDALCINGIMTKKFPIVPGHEVYGTVAEVGSGVERFKVGDVVGRGWHGGHCFQCDPCMKGHFGGCHKHMVTGITMDGGCGQYMVSPYEALARLPTGLKAEETAPLLCAGLTCYNAMRMSGGRAGDLVAVQGIGGLGHIGIQIAQKMGFEVAAVSSGAGKAKEAKEMGAHHYIDASAQKPAEQLQKLGGARLVMATAYDAKAMSDLVEGMSPNGEMLVAAADPKPLTVSSLQLIPGRKKLVGVASGHAMDNEEFVKFAKLTGVKSISESFPLDKFQEAFDKMLAGKARFRAVLQPWQ